MQSGTNGGRVRRSFGRFVSKTTILHKIYWDLHINLLTLVDVIVPPPPYKQCWVLDGQLYNKSSCSSQATLLCRGGGEAEIHFYIGGLIIFVRDCLKFRKICEGFMHCFVDFIALLLLFYLINVHIEWQYVILVLCGSMDYGVGLWRGRGLCHTFYNVYDSRTETFKSYGKLHVCHGRKI